jgi:hypothetical protein
MRIIITLLIFLVHAGVIALECYDDGIERLSPSTLDRGFWDAHEPISATEKTVSSETVARQEFELVVKSISDVSVSTADGEASISIVFNTNWIALRYSDIQRKIETTSLYGGLINDVKEHPFQWAAVSPIVVPVGLFGIALGNTIDLLSFKKPRLINKIKQGGVRNCEIVTERIDTTTGPPTEVILTSSDEVPFDPLLKLTIAIVGSYASDATPVPNRLGYFKVPGLVAGENQYRVDIPSAAVDREVINAINGEGLTKIKVIPHYVLRKRGFGHTSVPLAEFPSPPGLNLGETIGPFFAEVDLSRFKKSVLLAYQEKERIARVATLKRSFKGTAMSISGQGEVLPDCPEDLNVTWHNCSGTIFHPNAKGEYTGGFQHDLRHGQGIMTMPDGSKYLGEFRDDSINGQGVYTWLGGARLSGWFEDGLPTKGTYYMTTGDKYVGEFKGLAMSGSGKLTDANGRITEGVFEDDAVVSGTVTFPNGLRREIVAGEIKQYKKGFWDQVGDDFKKGAWASLETAGQQALYNSAMGSPSDKLQDQIDSNRQAISSANSKARQAAWRQRNNARRATAARRAAGLGW